MSLLEAIRLALRTIRAQKLKSFFSLIGVLIGVTFLIAVVSIVQGMNRYMVDRFANTLVGANTFEVRQRPSINMGHTTREMWMEWLRRPRVSYGDADYVRERIGTPATFAKFCQDRVSVHYAGMVAKDVDLIGGLPYRIIGVVAPQGTLFGLSLDKFVVMPFSAPGRRLICPINILDAMIVQTDDPVQMQLAMAEAEAAMRSRRQLKPGEDNNFHLQTAEGALDT